MNETYLLTETDHKEMMVVVVVFSRHTDILDLTHRVSLGGDEMQLYDCCIKNKSAVAA